MTDDILCIKVSFANGKKTRVNLDKFSCYIESCTSIFDDVIITHLKSDNSTFIDVYNGLSGSYEDPTDWVLLGFKIFCEV